MVDPKKQLTITLAEPIAFLRTSDPSGRHQPDPHDSPTLVRGILTLNVTKPIEISSIEVELTGTLAIIHTEAFGARRIDFPDKQNLYTSTVTVFRADHVPHGRQSASVGPGLPAANANEADRTATTSARPPSLPRGRSERRTLTTGAPPDLGPTPPYTPTAQSPPPIQTTFGAPGEHPAQTLAELRQALRGNLEGQAHRDGLISPLLRSRSIAFPLPNSTVNSVTSSISSESLHRGNDNRSDDALQASPSFEGNPSFRNTTEGSPHAPSHGGPPSPSGPSRAHSLENSHETQPRPRGSGRDSSNPPASRSRLRISLAPVLDAVREVTSRAPSRSRGVTGPDERERGRTRVRVIPEEQSRENASAQDEDVNDTGNGSQMGVNGFHPNGHAEHREHHLLGLGRVLGFEHNPEKEKDGEQKFKEHGENWREFKSGTYSYPISFLLPPHLPPTFSVPYGSLSYVIKGVVHRPGTFTSKLSCQVPLLVVTAPAIGAGEGGGAGDPGPLFVQNEWQGKLAYSFGLSSPVFLLGSERHLDATPSEGVRTNTDSGVEDGVEARAEAAYGTATLDLTLLPLEKVKIWRLDMVVDQRIRYVDEHGRHLRDDERSHVKLLQVQDTCSSDEIDLGEEEHAHKNKQKHKHDMRIPLLPTPVSPHRSPLLQYLTPSLDPSTLAGPGPYTLSTNIGLPGCNDPSSSDSGLHFTMKQKSSCVKVEHTLKLAIRVECVGDEETNVHEEGEAKKLFDITVQAPICVLSCRCVPECQTLPKYSQITQDNSHDHAACPCQPNIARSTEQVHGNEAGSYLTPSSTSSFGSENGITDEHRNGHEHSRSPSHAHGGGHASPHAKPLHPHPHPHPHPPSPASRTPSVGLNRSPSHAHAPIVSHGQHHHTLSQSSTSHVSGHLQTPPSRPPSPLARYQRLVSGLESEAGEAPPAYESIASGP